MSHLHISVKFFVLLLCQLLSRKRLTSSCELRDYAYAISIRLPTREGLQQSCSGVLLQTRWVLTAAHCAVFITDPSAIHILGSVNSPFIYHMVQIEAIYITDLYDSKTQDNDICLLYTAEPFPPMATFGRIPSRSFTDACSDVIIVTWKEKRMARASPMEPYCLSVAMENMRICLNIFSTISDPDTILCTTYGQRGELPCRGDSGGPLVCSGVVIGVVSWGVDCENKYSPSIFARIDTAIGFINDTLYRKDGTVLREEKFRGGVVYGAWAAAGRPRGLSGLLFVLTFSVKFFVS